MPAALLLLSCLLAGGVFAEDQAEPEIGITLRGVDDGIVEQGEPLRIALYLTADDGEIVFAPASGTWADAVTVELLRADGQAVVASASAVGTPGAPTLKLGPYDVVGSTWRVTSESMQSVPPGDYLLRAKLAIPAAAPGGWNGELLSEDVALTVVASSDDPARVAQSTIARASDAMLDGRLEDAAGIIDPLLADQPANFDAWVLRAAVSEQAGNIPGALIGINRAQDLFDGIEPDLEASLNRLALAQQDPNRVDASTLPDWTWPPGTFDGPLPPAVANPPVIGAAKPPVAGVAAAAAPALTPKETDTAAGISTPVEGAVVRPLGELSEDRILADASGQWAATASASSEYAADRYSAMRATGAPDVDRYSDNPNAWCHSGRSVAQEWLEVGFAHPVRATELRVRQTYTPGTLSRIEAFGAGGEQAVLWEGTDPNTYPPGEISWFMLRFPETRFEVSRVRLTLNVGAINGWKQIDAVQLIGAVH